MRKTSWFVALFILLAVVNFMSAQETKIINGYKVARGERPVIDLSKVPKDAYETGRIWIKLVPEMENLMPDNKIYQSETKGISLKTGITKIDQVNEKYGIEKIKPKQYGFYEISPASVKFRDRHKAWGFHLWMEVYLPEGTDVIQAVKDYMSLPEVEFAEPVYKDELYAGVDPKEFPNPKDNGEPKLTVDDTRYNEQWHYNNTGQAGGTPDCDIDLPEAWDIERGNSAVLIAIQDMGIQYDHPDLDAHIWSGLGYDFQADDSTIDPGHHGTHVAGTVSAESDNGIGVSGIAGGSGSGDGVTLMSVQVYASDGSGGGNSNLPYEYSADNDSAISQNSWGYTSVGYYDQLVLDGIDYFNVNGGGSTLDGGLVIFAAGNSDATGLWYPGCYSGAMAVASTSFTDERAYYSNYGSWVEVAAPGGDYYDGVTAQVLSTYVGSTYDWLQGTSMACPHVTGLAALIVSLGPGVFTNQQVRDIIADTTDYIDDINPTYAGELGTGRINAYAALQMAEGMLAPPEAPALSYPGDGTTITASKPNFQWSDPAGASTFDILVDDNSNFSSPVIQQTVSTNSYTPSSDLAEGTYYWKVIAENTAGSSPYSATWDFTVSLPDINLSVSQIAVSAEPDGSISDQFAIENNGNYTLTYNGITPSYTGALIPGGNWISNDFSTFPGTGWTNSGWVAYSGGARATGSGVTCTLTSPAFDTSGAGNPVYIDFTQNFYFKTGSWIKVEYYTGSAWVQVYYATASTSTAQHIELPVKSASTQVRFTAYTTRAQAQTAYWDIDNIIVAAQEVPYSWLTVNSSTSGTVPVSGSDNINITCDATGLTEGVYNADLIVVSDDPDEPSKVLPVEFTVVIGSTPLTAPINVTTSVAGTILTVSWDGVTGATSYDIYSSTEPYGTFTLVTNVSTNSYVTSTDQAKLFWYVVAKN